MVEAHDSIYCHGIGCHYWYDHWPGGEVLVDMVHYGRNATTELGRGLGEPPVHRAGGGLCAGPVSDVLVVPHGTGLVDGQPAIVPVQ